nr:unnamed protein product [Callosobruchus chinensis]
MLLNPVIIKLGYISGIAHRIPKDSCLCAIWLQRINNPKLNGSDKLSSYFICEEHFHPMCIEKSSRLRRYSLSIINLPSK